MPDHLTSQQRHRNMAAIRAKDTKPELIVRRYLWSHGFRYRLNYRRLPGKPDIVLRKYRTCIFVNGCFWHGHNLATLEVKGERLNVKNWEGSLGVGMVSSACCKIPKTNRGFWVRKIMRNKERDVEVQRKLARMGWHCIVVWECELKPARRQMTLDALAHTLYHIFLLDRRVKPYAVPDDADGAMVAEEELES